MIIDQPRPEYIPALGQLWQQAFGDTQAFLDHFFATGFSPDRCRCLFAENTLAAALYWFDCKWEDKRIAYLYAVATDKQFQGKGFCRQLMENTHRHLESLGYAGAILVPGSMQLFTLYEKMGYTPCCPVETVTAKANNQKAELQKVDPDTYHRLRQQMLPKDAVIQEQNALDFAAGFYEFYAGEDMLVCVSREKKHLNFQEYLADPKLLSSITHTLGGKTGTARFAQGNHSYAMYHSLGKDNALPAYFQIPLN